MDGRQLEGRSRSGSSPDPDPDRDRDSGTERDDACVFFILCDINI